jgi:phosphate transport system substrate-binding protein
VEFIELPVARDAITVIVNAKNTWAESMTVAELRALWAPEADTKVTKWSQVRKGWPEQNIALFGPGAESGTFDYFTAAINGGARASRRDYTASGDDSTIINGVAADQFALGYVGYGYYERAKNRLKSVAIDDLDDSIGQGPILPSPQSVGRGVYRPLSRILFIYVNNSRTERPEVRALVDDYLRHAGERAAQVGTIALMSNVYDLARQRFTKRRTGTMYGSPSAAELGIEYLLTQ